MHHLVTIVPVGLLVVLAAGCSSATARFYTLNATVPPATPTSTHTLVVGPVSIPAVVDRPQMVVSTGANQATLDEFNRWASPLQDNLSRVMVENLVALLGTSGVVLSQATLSAEADYRVTVEVQRFESTLGQSALLDAVWIVRRMKDGRTQTGRTTVRESVQESSYDALAAAHSRAVGRLCQDIADAVRVLDRAG
jgi:uncharacterized lipoprotein YmbA